MGSHIGGGLCTHWGGDTAPGRMPRGTAVDGARVGRRVLGLIMEKRSVGF